jgi:hypothetical protein
MCETAGITELAEGIVVAPSVSPAPLLREIPLLTCQQESSLEACIIIACMLVDSDLLASRCASRSSALDLRSPHLRWMNGVLVAAHTTRCHTCSLPGLPVGASVACAAARSRNLWPSGGIAESPAAAQRRVGLDVEAVPILTTVLSAAAFASACTKQSHHLIL